jgi:hypothetical protein
MTRPRTVSQRKKESARAASASTVSLMRLAPVLVSALFFVAIFLLPYQVPLHTPSNSQSWEFGFNNTVAQLLIALLLLFLFGWQLVFSHKPLEEDPVAQTLVPEERSPGSLRTLLLTLGILEMFACALLLAWYTILPMTHYGEFTYCLQRVEAMLLGRAPYVDFSFDYGPALLATPYAIYNFFHGALSVEAAYGAALIIHYVIGLGLATYIISQVRSRGRVFVLAMVGFQLVNLTMGIQYTPVRFTIALASIFAIRHLHRATRDFPMRQAVLLAIAAFLLPLANFSISPELGIALTLALGVYFFWFVFGPQRRLALLVLPVLAGVAVAGFLFPRPYFNAMLSFGKGGGSFPIFPSIHILTFLAAAMLVIPRLGIIAVRDKSPAGPFCAGLAILCGLFILPSTGRCDPGHVWSNSVGLFIIAVSAVSWMRQKWWYSLWAIYFLVFPFFNEVSFWDHYRDPIQSFLNIRSQLSSYHYDPDNYANLAPGSPRPPIHYSKLLPMGGELLELPKVNMGLPLGDNETLERYLILNHRYIPQYHIAPYDDIFDDADLEREYKDLRSMEYIFVPTYCLNFLRPVNPTLQLQAQGEADCKFLTGLLLFPVNLTAVHMLFQPDMEVMKHIASEYVLVKQYQNGVLLKRKE